MHAETLTDSPDFMSRPPAIVSEADELLDRMSAGGSDAPTRTEIDRFTIRSLKNMAADLHQGSGRFAKGENEHADLKARVKTLEERDAANRDAVIAIGNLKDEVRGIRRMCYGIGLGAVALWFMWTQTNIRPASIAPASETPSATRAK